MKLKCFFVIVTVVFYVSELSFAQKSLFLQMDSLATSIGYEFVSPDKFPEINDAGSYGSPYVYNIIPYAEGFRNKNTLLFLARQPIKFGESELINAEDLNPYWDYVYILVFATKYKDSSHFDIVHIIEEDVNLFGMTFYYMDLKLSFQQFRRVDDPSISGLEGVNVSYANGSIPILISTEIYNRILYFYEGNWYEYVELLH